MRVNVGDVPVWDFRPGLGAAGSGTVVLGTGWREASDGPEEVLVVVTNEGEVSLQDRAEFVEVLFITVWESADDFEALLEQGAQIARLMVGMGPAVADATALGLRSVDVARLLTRHDFGPVSGFTAATAYLFAAWDWQSHKFGSVDE